MDATFGRIQHTRASRACRKAERLVTQLAVSYARIPKWRLSETGLTSRSGGHRVVCNYPSNCLCGEQLWGTDHRASGHDPCGNTHNWRWGCVAISATCPMPKCLHHIMMMMDRGNGRLGHAPTLVTRQTGKGAGGVGGSPHQRVALPNTTERIRLPYSFVGKGTCDLYGNDQSSGPHP